MDQEALSSEEYKTAESLMMEVELLSQETFYGRCLGFQVGFLIMFCAVSHKYKGLFTLNVNVCVFVRFALCQW